MLVLDKQSDITLEQASRISNSKLNFTSGQTVAADVFQLKQDIEKTKLDIKKINWVFSMIIVGATAAIVLMLVDYFQYVSKAYDQFNIKIEEQNINQKTIEFIKKDIEFIKNNLKNN
jgi:hypothetical protein